VVNEREDALRLLRDYNVDLEQKVAKTSKQVKGMYNKVFANEKLGAFGILTSEISKRIGGSMEKIAALIKDSEGLVKVLKEQTKQADLKTLEADIKKISKLHKEVMESYHFIQQQADRSHVDQVQMKSVNIHILLDQCIQKVILEKIQGQADFHISIDKEFDKDIPMIFALPEDLLQVFSIFLDNAFSAMKKKKKEFGNDFVPHLGLRTIDKESAIRVVIRDNGIGVSEEYLSQFFSPFSESADEVGYSNLSVFLAYDIIVFLYKGEIKADSKKGEYFQVIIDLPKSIL
jgi:nitrogen-specific signal transduction histidine kinase